MQRIGGDAGGCGDPWRGTHAYLRYRAVLKHEGSKIVPEPYCLSIKRGKISAIT